MTKQVFIQLAAEFAALKADPDASDFAKRIQAEEDMRVSLARRVASVLKADNPSFDRARFLKACGVDD